MPLHIHVEAVQLILSAIYSAGDRLLSAFMIKKPGAGPFELGQMGTEIFYRPKEYMQALLYVRQHGAPYLRSISISQLRSMVTDFLIQNFWHIKDGEFTRRPDRSYSEQISPSQKMVLAEALETSVLFQSKPELTLFPLLPIRVAANFDAKHFFVIHAADLSSTYLPGGIKNSDIEPAQFPPMKGWSGKKCHVISWLGIRSPTALVSRKMASAILGAVALTPSPRDRYMFSGRKMFGGQCTVTSNEYLTAPQSEPHTPAMMHDMVLTIEDGGWLTLLNTLFDGSDKPSRGKLRALEYFYRAWFLDPRERFPILCMSLDSLVGASRNHTSEMVKYVKKLVGPATDDKRLGRLMRVRGAVIHGAAPDVYDSEHYESYYVNYKTDPIYDLELIVAKCLREAIFGSALKYHAHPNALQIADLQAKGRLPLKMDEDCIIAGDI